MPFTPSCPSPLRGKNRLSTSDVRSIAGPSDLPSSLRSLRLCVFARDRPSHSIRAPHRSPSRSSRLCVRLIPAMGSGAREVERNRCIDGMISHGGTGITEECALYPALTVIPFFSRKDAKSAKKNFDWEGDESTERHPVLHGHTPGITTAHFLPRR